MLGHTPRVGMTSYDPGFGVLGVADSSDSAPIVLGFLVLYPAVAGLVMVTEVAGYICLVV